MPASNFTEPMPPGESSVTVFLPVYNEASSIESTLREFYDGVVRPLSGTLLVCEDGSTDGTGEVLRRLATQLPMRLVQGPHRKGYAGAMRDGLRLVDTTYVFIADSDGQYDPSEFWKIWRARDSYDMVIGRKVERQEKAYRSFLSRGFHILVKAFVGVRLHDMDCGFRLIRRKVVDEVLPEVGSLQYSFLAEFSILADRQGFQILEVPVAHRNRHSGSSTIYAWNRLPRILVAQVLGLLRLAYRLNRAPPSVAHDSRSSGADI
jgi:glycosyltransferase involved in cell wall biosynthesis